MLTKLLHETTILQKAMEIGVLEGIFYFGFDSRKHFTSV